MAKYPMARAGRTQMWSLGTWTIAIPHRDGSARAETRLTHPATSNCGVVTSVPSVSSCSKPVCEARAFRRSGSLRMTYTCLQVFFCFWACPCRNLTPSARQYGVRHGEPARRPNSCESGYARRCALVRRSQRPRWEFWSNRLLGQLGEHAGNNAVGFGPMLVRPTQQNTRFSRTSGDKTVGVLDPWMYLAQSCTKKVVHASGGESPTHPATLPG